MTSIELVREFFPKATDAEADDILWGRTVFPFSGKLDDPAVLADLRKSLAAFKDAEEKGIRLCDFCPEPALESSTLCEKCESNYRNFKVTQRLMGK